jgi:alkylation response protein AidB-like acyl-CoA dehydrogenase
MTEKLVASSDATNVTSAITRVGSSSSGGGVYRVQGLKWWTSGAMDPRCKVGVCCRHLLYFTCVGGRGV